MARKVAFLMDAKFEMVPRSYKQAVTLTEIGYDVQVLSLDNAGDRVVEGVKVKSVRSNYFSKRINLFSNKYLNYMLNFPIIAFLLMNSSRKTKADIYHCCGFATLPIGVMFKVISGKKLIYDSREDYLSQAANKASIGFLSELMRYTAYVYESLFTRFADHVFVRASLDEELKKRYSKFNDKVTIIQNVPEFKEHEDPSSNEDKHTAIYIGGVTKSKGIMEIVKAMSYAQETIPTAKLVILGPTQDGIKTKATRYINDKELKNITFHKPVPYTEVPKYLRNASVGMWPYQPYNKDFKKTKGSSKIFMYMRAGLPIVASNFPGIAEIIEESGCGILINPTDPEEIGEALIEIFTNPEKARELGRNGREAFEKRYNWEKEKEKIKKIYREISSI